MAAQSILKMQGICKTFPGVVALDQVNFDLFAGEVHILLGENGAGKSTLMKILSGAYPKSEGEIFLFGEPVEIKNPRHAQELGISIIYQEFNLIPYLTAGENIFLGREPQKIPGIIDYTTLYLEAQNWLNEIGATVHPRAPIKSLSVAEQQMVEVAKALSLDAKILIMDEPTSSLTDKEIQQLFAAIRHLQEKGVGIIYISHRLEEIFAIGNRVTVLRDGRYIASHLISEVTSQQLIKLMANRELKEHFPKKRAATDVEILRVENLSSGNFLKNIRFSLRRGEILGIAGLLGAGRTELARVIFGADPMDSGAIWIKGKRVNIRSPYQAIQLGMGYLAEDRKSNGLILILSVKDNINLPNFSQLSHFGIIDLKAEKSLSERFVKVLRIKTPSIHQKVMFLSGGNQQKVVLAKWLARNADILIFDEPTRGIDVGAKVEIYQLMNQLTAQGAGIIMISSELLEILRMSDRILVMHQGTISAEFHAGAATQEKILKAALGNPM